MCNLPRLDVTWNRFAEHTLIVCKSSDLSIRNYAVESLSNIVREAFSQSARAKQEEAGNEEQEIPRVSGSGEGKQEEADVQETSGTEEEGNGRKGTKRKSKSKILRLSPILQQNLLVTLRALMQVLYEFRVLAHMHTHTYTHTHTQTQTQTHKHTNTQTHKHTNTPKK